MGVMPRSPKGRAAARGLDARLRLQHAYMPAGDASLKTAQLIKMLVDSNHGIYREPGGTSSPSPENAYEWLAIVKLCAAVIS